MDNVYSESNSTNPFWTPCPAWLILRNYMASLYNQSYLIRNAFFGRVLQVTSSHRRQLSSVVIVGQAKWPRPRVKKLFSKCNNKCSKREETRIFHCCHQSAMMKLNWYLRYQTIDYDKMNLIFLSSSTWLHTKGEFFFSSFWRNKLVSITVRTEKVIRDIFRTSHVRVHDLF